MYRSPHLTAARAAAVTLTLALSLAAALTLSGCTLGEPDAPLAGDPIPVPIEPPSAVPTTAPDAPAVERVSVEVGELAVAGVWRLTVRRAEIIEPADSAAGAAPANAARTLEVEFELGNSSADPLRVTPGDFTLAIGGASVFPDESGGHGLASAREIAAGASEALTGRFDLSGTPAEAPLTFVFAPAEGAPARIEVRIETP